MSTTTTVTVTGMTCGCCVNKVRDKVGALPGVTGVDVDLTAGSVTIDGTEPERTALADAVAAAGFQLAD
ncbi:heavy metal-associated domain-containing protein [Nocardia sp. NPDC060220]|uniref:heavy-metal-associated domain-containing protein n=1 Tax=Nocardia sp. NPDC060220 TaxID=3347076 RepID=UPI00364BAF0E